MKAQLNFIYQIPFINSAYAEFPPNLDTYNKIKAAAFH